jgi:hypothetical protein
MDTNDMEYEAVVFKKFDAALQAAIKTDFVGYELTGANPMISVIIELSAAPCQEFIKESSDKHALLVPAHLSASSLFISANGSIDWLKVIARLECVAAIELTSQLRPARPDQRRPIAKDIAFSAQARSNEKTILGIIDHGCPIFHSALVNNNTSRILAMWDQDESPDFSPLNTCPQTMRYGRQILREDINAWIKKISPHANGLNEDLGYAIADYPALRSRFTHGAMTAGLFAGPLKSPSLGVSNSDAGQAIAAKVVNTADTVFVQLPRRGLLAPSTGAANRSILDGLRYILGCAGDKTEKIVVCIPYGNIQGPHDGGSMVERAIDAMVDETKKSGKTLEVVFPSGNTFNKPTLAKVSLSENDVAKLAWCLPPDAETVMTAEIWMDKAHLPKSIEILPPIAQQTKISVDLASLQQEPIVIKAGAHVLGVAVLKDYGTNVLLMVQWIPPALSSPAALSFQRRWEFVFTAGDAIDQPIHCYLGWGGKNLGFEQRVRPSSWIALTEGVDITGDGSLLGTACGKNTYVIGACEKWGAHRRTAYSGAGMPRGGTKSGVNCLAIAEESVWLPGIVCIGTRSGTTTRMNGSSVAAPQAARVIANTGVLKTRAPFFKAPPSIYPLPVPGHSDSTSVSAEPILDDAS